MFSADKPRVRCIEGSATLTIAMSRVSMNCAAQSSARIRFERWRVISTTSLFVGQFRYDNFVEAVGT